MRSIAMSMPRIGLSVCPLAYLKNRTSKLCEVFCMLPAAVARSSSDDNGICYVRLVLCLTIATAYVDKWKSSR